MAEHASRQRYSSGAPWEARVGYSRALRVGPHVYIAGTTAVNAAGEPVAVGDAYRQTEHILRTIQEALQAVDARIDDVVRTRIYVTTIDNWEAVGRAHHAFFRDIRPVATLVEVSRLIAPELLVEIEAEAVISTLAPVPDA